MAALRCSLLVVLLVAGLAHLIRAPPPPFEVGDLSDIERVFELARAGTPSSGTAIVSSIPAKSGDRTEIEFTAVFQPHDHEVMVFFREDLKTSADEDLPFHSCFTFLFPVNAKKPADLFVLTPSTYPECRISGTFIVELFLKLSRLLNYTSAELIDSSQIYCPTDEKKTRPAFSLRDILLITTGNTWYCKLGFSPRMPSPPADAALKTFQTLPLTQLLVDFESNEAIMGVLSRFLNREQDEAGAAEDEDESAVPGGEQLLPLAEGKTLKLLMETLFRETRSSANSPAGLQACLDLVELGSHVVEQYMGGDDAVDKLAREKLAALKTEDPDNDKISTLCWDEETIVASKFCHYVKLYKELRGKWLRVVAVW